MKYLSDYMQEAQTELFNQVGSFFAYNPSQYNEEAKEGVTYSNVGHGMFCPAENVETLINGLQDIYTKAISQDIAENGKEKIIEREIGNHECLYTYDLTDARVALSDYGFSEEDIQSSFKKLLSEKH